MDVKEEKVLTSVRRLYLNQNFIFSFFESISAFQSCPGNSFSHKFHKEITLGILRLKQQ